VFEQFTERSQIAVALARDEALALGHNYIGTEHLLLGLLREQRSPAAQVLEVLGVRVGEVRAEVERIIGRGDGATRDEIAFTPRAKKVLERSVREADGSGADSVGTEHILLGLVRVRDGIAARILVDSGADLHALRKELRRMVAVSRSESPRAG
jgi:ATP-dependent Clp protease ATP-binding subunit ClpC